MLRSWCVELFQRRLRWKFIRRLAGRRSPVADRRSPVAGTPLRRCTKLLCWTLEFWYGDSPVAGTPLRRCTNLLCWTLESDTATRRSPVHRFAGVLNCCVGRWNLIRRMMVIDSPVYANSPVYQFVVLNGTGTQQQWRLFLFVIFSFSIVFVYFNWLSIETSNQISFNSSKLSQIQYSNWFSLRDSNNSINFSANSSASNVFFGFGGVNPPLSPGHVLLKTHHFAFNFQCNPIFHSFTTSFTAIEPFSQHFRISPGIISIKTWPPMLLTGPPFHYRRRTRSNLATLLLLVIGGVEMNPGPSSASLAFGVLNTRSVVNKASLLHSLISDNDLDILALTETWVGADDPPVIKSDPAPSGYRITHVHRDNPEQTMGGGLAVIHRDTITVQPRKHKLTHSSFELQIVNIGLKSRDIVLANIYRPPSSSKPLFFEEFGLLLTNLGTDAVDRLLICGDFNLPGTSPDKIDSGLAELLESTSFTQFVNSPTRHDSHHLTSSLLDLIITPSPSNLVSATSVVSSHEISDHDLTLANLNTKRLKSPQRTYQYRNIKDIDLQSFQHNILSSSLVSDPDPTVDGYADQMESVITSALDRAAPLKTGRRSGPRKAKNWLSPDAIEAKKRRRRLEWRWKASNAEPDRLAYRAACSTTNKLITHSRAASNLKCINEASSHPKRLWGTIKSPLHSSQGVWYGPPFITLWETCHAEDTDPGIQLDRGLLLSQITLYITRRHCVGVGWNLRQRHPGFWHRTSCIYCQRSWPANHQSREFAI